MACLVLWLSSFEDNRVIQLVIMTLFVNLKFPINVRLEYYSFTSSFVLNPRPQQTQANRPLINSATFLTWGPPVEPITPQVFSQRTYRLAPSLIGRVPFRRSFRLFSGVARVSDPWKNHFLVRGAKLIRIMPEKFVFDSFRKYSISACKVVPPG